jgi:hypothetical protein
MKVIVILAGAASALSLAACDRNGAPTFGPDRPLSAVSRLDCPDHQGDLRKVSAAGDGQTCTYSDDDGAEVNVQILRTSGDPHAALKPIETSLMSLADVSASSAPPASGPAATVSASAADRSAAAKADADASADANVSAAGAEVRDHGRDADQDDDTTGRDRSSHHGGSHNDKVDVDLPGVHVHANGDDTAKVDVMGVHVTANGEDGAHIVHQPKSGYGRSFTVDAGDNGAIVRTERNTRSNFSALVVFTGPVAGREGDHTIGYVARGPRTGPLVVATVRIKRDDKGNTMDDADKLVRRLSRG